ncbi:ubiquitin-conjugating enzyme e2 j1 [Stemphylium lycopersici]|nr:ubiquitin-conjugating enzyme e2 j1 [Stemphylium lycopersici]
MHFTSILGWAMLFTGTALTAPTETSTTIDMIGLQKRNGHINVETYSGGNCGGTNQGTTHVGTGGKCVNSSNAGSIHIGGISVKNPYGCRKVHAQWYLGTGCGGTPGIQATYDAQGCQSLAPNQNSARMIRGVTRSDSPSGAQPTAAEATAMPYPSPTASHLFTFGDAPTLAEGPSRLQQVPLADNTSDPLPLHPVTLTPWSDDEQLVNLYYLNFHSSHPILLPRHMYWEHGYPRCLKAVVHYVGGCFSPAVSRDDLRKCAARELAVADQATPGLIQARLLYAIALFAQNAALDGQNMLDTAIQDALALGMHQRNFAARHADRSTILEESMRRTWWELYVTDGCIAALQRKSTFKTNTVDADVLLPCEDFIYEGGMCFVPPTLAEYHDNVFAEQEKVFSSYCYRIEAARLLGRVLTITGTHGVHRDLVQAVDNSLAAFLHHLPRSKTEAEISNTFGELDELMFQAHTIIQWATILLHYPRGDLLTPDSLAQTVPGANCTKLLCPCNRQHVHSVKAVEASRTIAMLAALQAPAQKHSPLFVYPIALATVVQISIGAIHARNLSPCLEQHSDRVKLLLGVCKTLGRYWPSAESMLRTLKKVAGAVFRSSHFTSSGTLHQDCPTGDSALSLGSIPIERNPFDDLDLNDLYGLVGLDSEPMRM